MRELTRIVDAADAGRKVKFFVRGGMGVSYHQFTSLKQTGGIRVNGEAVHANHLLNPGDVVTVVLEDAPREAVVPDPTPVNVAYEDEDILIIDKPAPLATQCSVRQAGMTLENRLAYRYRDDPGFVFRPLNRLDRGTSGLMAAAKNAHAAQRLQKQLHTDRFVREYLAIVEGPMTGAGVIDAPIAKADAATVRRIVDWEKGVRAVTHYQVLRTGEDYSLVRLRLDTGRTHQIRVHLQHLGHPIVGDFLYGHEDPRLPGRFALHSTYLRLNHPITGEVIEYTSPLPEALKDIMQIKYIKATLDQLDWLVETRLEVLRAANGLADDADLSDVARESRDYYMKALADGSHVGYLAFDGDSFIGAGGVSYYQVMPTCHNPTGRKAYIMNMYVRPAWRRRGIATHMLDLLVKDARDRGIGCITLEATDAGRPLYEKYGFVAMAHEMELPCPT